MRLLIILFLALISIQLIGQDKPLFEGSEKLDHCRVDLPLDYSTKNEENLQRAARSLENMELVLMKYDKKTGVTYQRVFVVVEETSKGSVFVFLLSPEDHAKSSGSKTAMFIKYEPKKQRFYNAACFDQVLESDDTLKRMIKEQ
jgi:hypothetical protein